MRLTRTPRVEAPDDPATRERILGMLVGDMAAAASSIGARLLVLHLPYLERGRTNPAPEPLRRAVGRSAGVLFLDLAPAVARHYAGPAAPPLRFDRDRHPNPAAHVLFAREIDAFARREGLAPIP